MYGGFLDGRRPAINLIGFVVAAGNHETLLKCNRTLITC